jgi:hypothetical protein
VALSAALAAGLAYAAGWRAGNLVGPASLARRIGRQVEANDALREVREAVSGYRRATLPVEVAAARTALPAAGMTWQEDVAAVELPPELQGVLVWTGARP